MYDIVSELNASKTQVFECKQDCGRYLSYDYHMQSHSCEYCSCSCFKCLLSSKPKESITSKVNRIVSELSTSGSAVVNPSSGAYDNGPLMVNAATTDVNILGEVVEDVIIDDNNPAVNTTGAEDGGVSAADDDPAFNTMRAEVGVVSADDDDNSLKINGKINNYYLNTRTGSKKSKNCI